MDKEIKSIAVVVPTITGREEEFDRCMSSINKAISKCSYNVKVFSDKDSSRERILIENIDEIKNFDRVTFIDDDDYVNKYYFDSLPSITKEDEIIQCLGLGLWLYPRSKCLVYGTMSNFFDGPVTRETEVGELYDCHIWGYFFPSEMILRLTKELLIPNPEITGALEDVCYWAWIVTNYKFRLIETNSAIYYHMKLIKGLIDEIKWDCTTLVNKAKDINPEIEYYMSDSGMGVDIELYYSLWGLTNEVGAGIIDGMALKEFGLTAKEKETLREWMKTQDSPVTCKEFLELLKG